MINLRFISGVHTFISGVHTFISDVHTLISGVHTFISGVHTFISGVHTFITGVHTFYKILCALLRNHKFYAPHRTKFRCAGPPQAQVDVI